MSRSGGRHSRNNQSSGPDDYGKRPPVRPPYPYPNQDRRQPPREYDPPTENFAAIDPPTEEIRRPVAGERSTAKALLLAAASAVVPGAAHFASGRRRAGYWLLTLGVALALGLGAFVLTHNRTDFIQLAVQPRWLAVISGTALALAIAGSALIIGSYRVARPARPSFSPPRKSGQVAVAFVLALLCVLVAGPPLVVARYAMVQRDLINSVFADGEGGKSVTAGGDGKAATKEDPWAGRDRVNVLMLASDAGPDRTGVRTDSMILMSIETHTGNVTMFSLPRNLQNAPLPDGPLKEKWGDTFPDLLNAVYKLATDDPNLLKGFADRGAQAIKEVIAYILGIPVDYYVMANLAGFEQFVNALGGVTVNVTERLPIGGVLADGTHVPPIGYIEPGVQKLNGYYALWYSRSRRDSSDYDRILRQRCLIGAMARQADPVNVLKNFQGLAGATKRLMSTDIPRQILPALVELGEKIKTSGNIGSVAFVPPLINTANPNMTVIRSTVRKALATKVSNPKPAGTSAAPKPSTTTKPGNGGATTSRPSGGSNGTAKPSGSGAAGSQTNTTNVDQACGLG